MTTLRMTAAAAVLALAGTACGSDAVDRGAAPLSVPRCEPGVLLEVGDRIPLECSFERLEGGVLDLADLEGRPSVINFWASTCTFCVREMPEFQDAYEILSGRVEFLGVDHLGYLAETRSGAVAFARKTGVGYPLVYDPEGLLYSHFSRLLLMPATILVTEDGTIAHRQFGPVDRDRLLALVAEKLGVA